MMAQKENRDLSYLMSRVPNNEMSLIQRRSQTLQNKGKSQLKLPVKDHANTGE